MAETVTSTGGGLQEILQKAAVHYTTVGDLTYSVLRQAILNGVLEPGQLLRQDALAEALGVSRLPVRSALLQLESDGLIELRPHRGALVTALTPDQIRHIYDARLALEAHLLRRAIDAMTPEKLTVLEGLAAEVDAAEAGDDFLKARLRFYNELYSSADNPLILSMIEKLRSDVGRYWLRLRVAKKERHHATLLRYIRAGDAEGAVRWRANHLAEVAGELAALVVSKDGGKP